MFTRVLPLRDSQGQRVSMNQAETTTEGEMSKQIVVAAGGILLVASIGAQAFTGQQFAKDAKVGIAEARTTAVTARPGKIVDELEKEPGGGGPRNSFDIRAVKDTYEVGVDAQSGAVLESRLDGPNPD
jgi:uncharacterized membrane protein YkoI